MTRVLGWAVLVLFFVLPSRQAGAAVDPGKLEQETFTLINEYRKSNGFAPLIWSDAIMKVARKHSHEMATGDCDFGHDGFGDRVDQLKKALPGLAGAGENVLKTDDPNAVAQRAVTVWLHSPHHLKNIRGDFNYSGMGISVNEEGMIYFTQIFVKIVPPAQPKPPEPPPPTPSSSLLNILAPPTPRGH